MPDGTQNHFRFPKPRAAASRLRPGEIVVDLFAGGGGASEALLQALGRDPDIVTNLSRACPGRLHQLRRAPVAGVVQLHAGAGDVGVLRHLNFAESAGVNELVIEPPANVYPRWRCCVELRPPSGAHRLNFVSRPQSRPQVLRYEIPWRIDDMGNSELKVGEHLKPFVMSDECSDHSRFFWRKGRCSIHKILARPVHNGSERKVFAVFGFVEEVLQPFDIIHPAKQILPNEGARHTFQRRLVVGGLAVRLPCEPGAEKQCADGAEPSNGIPVNRTIGTTRPTNREILESTTYSTHG